MSERARRLAAGDIDWMVIGLVLLIAHDVLNRPFVMYAGPPPPMSWFAKLPRDYGKIIAATGPLLVALVSTFGQLSARLDGLKPERRTWSASISIVLIRSLAPSLGFFVFLSGNWLHPFIGAEFPRGSAKFLLVLIATISAPWLVVPVLAILVRHSPLHRAWNRRLGIEV